MDLFAISPEAFRYFSFPPCRSVRTLILSQSARLNNREGRNLPPPYSICPANQKAPPKGRRINPTLLPYDPYICQRTLISRERDIKVFTLIDNGCIPDLDTQIFCGHDHFILRPLEGHNAVIAFLVLILPDIPARKIHLLDDLHLILNGGVGVQYSPSNRMMACSAYPSPFILPSFER